MAAELESVTKFLRLLENHHTWYRIEFIRDESIMVFVATPRDYWEVEFMLNGSIEVERFRSAEFGGRELLDKLLRDYID